MSTATFDVVQPQPKLPISRLAGKVVIITGGASGIGASAVQIFHENGAKVVIADVQDKLGQALAKNLGEHVSYIHCNIGNEDEVMNLIDATVTIHGKLDVMYNNAGLGDHTFSILRSKKSDLERLISVNLVGALLGAKHAARVMKARGQGGCILFTASACASIGGLASNAYAMTKSEVVELSKNLAAELGGFGIRVNCVSPYGVMTPMNKVSGILVPVIEAAVSDKGNLQGKVLKAEDIARAALYLASDEARSVSGVNLVVDGGFSVVNPSMMSLSKKNLTNVLYMLKIALTVLIKFITRRM